MPVLTKPTKLEGDYSTWTEKSYSPVSDSDIDNDFFAYIDDEGNIAYVGDPGGTLPLKTLNLETGALVTLLASPAQQLGNVVTYLGNKNMSVLHKYYVSFDTSTNPYTVRVYKYGSLLSSYQLPSASTSVLVNISPSGRWIVIIDDDNNIYYVLEGS